ncbi:aconitate hydratase AcnA [Rugamonas apoptosis]|uniref:Aconitate hydratase n=1 Tax=Rugamonas apoptosis TaxID=2758570 RepID=A0A7W2FF98_9BURK|nr:aconitate hydratase AcnA [Rugamonas apoptosis]
MINIERPLRSLNVDGITYQSIDTIQACSPFGHNPYARLPYSLRILAENIARNVSDGVAREVALNAIVNRKRDQDLPFQPGRVVLQDLLGTPVLVDLAGLRDAVEKRGGNPRKVNPRVPVHLVIDHSLNVEHWGTAQALQQNMHIERQRNQERFEFLNWANKAFDNLSIIPSGKGILHQINLERLTPVIASQRTPTSMLAYPDSLVGTDSHTTMINAIGVLGWGVGGIEAEAAILGKALMMRLPEVVGVELVGSPPPGYIATDIALALSEFLRGEGVIGAYVEFFGAAAARLSVADRGTIANMAPEFGATAALFSIDQRTIDYMRMTGRSAHACSLTLAYAQAQGLWHDALSNAEYDRTLQIDLSRIGRAIAGPKQPHQRIILGPQSKAAAATTASDAQKNLSTDSLPAGAVVIAAITSCTNTSNPRAVLAAGLLARNALARGLRRAPWTKTSFAPGSRVVAAYLQRAGLQQDLDALGFNIIGYGCTTCNGMSGPLLSPDLEENIKRESIATIAVTSGNRNFEGRIHPLAREAFIMSPPLVVAYAIAGNGKIDPEIDPLGKDHNGQPVYLKDVWPTDAELDALEAQVVTADLFSNAYSDLQIDIATRADRPNIEVADCYNWNPASSYIRRPPYWDSDSTLANSASDLVGLRALAMLGDHITTDHISPSGTILPDSDTGRYLIAHGVAPQEFNSYGTRRGNHEAAMRATFASARLKNELVGEKEGPYSLVLPELQELTIFEAAQRYARRGTPLLVIAGKNYGSGSSRDWAAKGPRLLGVRAVLAESYERIHRANLAGVGILPLQFMNGQDRLTLNLTGRERFDIEGLGGTLQPGEILTVRISTDCGRVITISVRSRLDTHEEVAYFEQGGLLPQLLNEYLN